MTIHTVIGKIILGKRIKNTKSGENHSKRWLCLFLNKEKKLIKKRRKFPIGLRTMKTAVAVVIAMALVNVHGATTSKLIFAVIGAMSAVAPTFMESLSSCLTQIVGVSFGALIGVILMLLDLPIPSIVAAGIGILLVITLYHIGHIQFSPVLPSLIVVALCTTPDIQPMTYALGRLWDTAIGLGVGFLINTLVFPYNNRRQIRATAKSLDSEVILVLEEMFDGDDVQPDTEKYYRMINDMNSQLAIFSNQWLLLHLRKNKEEFESLKKYEYKAMQLIAHLEVLCQMETKGQLNEENRRLLKKFSPHGCIPDAVEAEKLIPTEFLGEVLGEAVQVADEDLIREAVSAAAISKEADIVTNYHVSAVLDLRRDLLERLKK